MGRERDGRERGGQRDRGGRGREREGGRERERESMAVSKQLNEFVLL